jgi:hypothetical protein
VGRLALLFCSAVIATGAVGCSGDSGGQQSPSSGLADLEIKVADVMGMDASSVHCFETGHVFLGEPLASCSFDDGTPGGCYNARTGDDLTVPARSEHDETEFPECWQ